MRTAFAPLAANLLFFPAAALPEPRRPAEHAAPLDIADSTQLFVDDLLVAGMLT
jgi:hypothetical protein